MANQGAGVASPLVAVSAQAVEALREQLAAVRAENTALREEVARQAAEVARKAEAAGLWQGRALTLETQLKQLTASVITREHGAPQEGLGTHAPPPTLWQRLRRVLGEA